MNLGSFLYADGLTPIGYECECCKRTGARLYRRYQTFLDHQTLLCRACAIISQDKQPESESEHAIGWLVAAVPTEDGSSFWGFTSVPEPGVVWWNNLPK